MKKFIKRQILYAKYGNKKIKLFNSNVGSNSKFEGNNIINRNSTFSGEIGFGSYLGSNCNIRAKIGRFTCIASNVVSVNGVHPTNTFVSMHPCFFSNAKQAGFSFCSQNKFKESIDIYGSSVDVMIGNDVWIGQNAILLAGIKIGDGAVVGAGALVNKDVPDYAVVVGVPARVIKYRFSENDIAFLQKFKWWNMPIEWIKENWDFFDNIQIFKEKFQLTE